MPFKPAELEKALPTLVVLLVNAPLAADDMVVQRLEALVAAIGQPQKWHPVRVLGTSEEALSALRARPQAKALKSPQGWSIEKLGGYALRPASAAMLALPKAHQLFARDPASSDGGANSAGRARLFKDGNRSSADRSHRRDAPPARSEPHPPTRPPAQRLFPLVALR